MIRIVHSKVRPVQGVSGILTKLTIHDWNIDFCPYIGSIFTTLIAFAQIITENLRTVYIKIVISFVLIDSILENSDEGFDASLTYNEDPAEIEGLYHTD